MTMTELSNSIQAIEFKEHLLRELTTLSDLTGECFYTSIIEIVLKVMVCVSPVLTKIDTCYGTCITSYTKTTHNWELTMHYNQDDELTGYIELKCFDTLIGKSKNMVDWMLGGSDKINYTLKVL